MSARRPTLVEEPISFRFFKNRRKDLIAVTLQTYTPPGGTASEGSPARNADTSNDWLEVPSMLCAMSRCSNIVPWLCPMMTTPRPLLSCAR